MAACIVSFVDLDGIRHSVEVEAEGLYEASVLGLCVFRKHELELGGLTQLEVEVRSSVKHTLTVTKVREWVCSGSRNSPASLLTSYQPPKEKNAATIPPARPAISGAEPGRRATSGKKFDQLPR